MSPAVAGAMAFAASTPLHPFRTHGGACAPPSSPSVQRAVHRSSRLLACTSETPSVTAPETTSSSDDPQLASSSTPTPPPSDDEEIRGHIISTLGWVGLAAAATPIVGYTRGWSEALEFVAAYVVEYSLSVDNLFVFLLIFGYFNVPKGSQKRVLTWGILGAMLMRGAMILAGAELTRRFNFVELGFAALLLYSAFKLLVEGDGNDDDEDLGNNRIVRFARSLVQVTEKFEGDRFFTVENGVRVATPLFLVLVCVELSDVVFALDSVPAVLGISDDTVVIYLSNILAIQGLRNLFFILSNSIGELRFLSQALAIVLGFVGCKMASGVFGYPVDIIPSLAVILSTLGAGVGLSLAFPESNKAS